MAYKTLEISTFQDFVAKTIPKLYSGKEKRELEAEVKEVLGTRKQVLAITFYEITTLLSLDIDTICDKLFKSYKYKVVVDLKTESDNKLKDFLSIFTQDARSISLATGIENSRLNRLLSGEFKNLYPDEVYGLSKAFGLKPSELFDYFYGDGERPVVGV